MVADFNKKRNNPYRRFFLKAGAVALLAVLALLAVADIKVYRRKQELATQVASLQQKVQALKDKNAKLQEGTERANDNDYIERLAREELDLQKPGEKVISFVKGTQQPQDDGAPKSGFSAWLGGAWDSLINVFKK